MEAQTDSQTTQIPRLGRGLKTVGQILHEQTADARCKCGAVLQVPEWLLVHMEHGALCDSCADAAAAIDQERVKHERREKRDAEWLSFCPDDYRDTIAEKLPRPGMLNRVLAWVYGRRGINIHGETGLGKSRCAWLLMRREFMAGRRMDFVNQSSGYDYAAMYDRPQGKQDVALWIAKMSTIPLLLMDDVFKVKMTDSFEQAVYTIVAARCENRLPIIMTSNDTKESLKDRMTSDRGAAMVRRLAENTERITFV
jgi:hypothetical protein